MDQNCDTVEVSSTMEYDSSHPKMNRSFKAKESFKGHIVSLDHDSYVVHLHDERTNEELISTWTISDLPEYQRRFLQEGSMFYYFVGTELNTGKEVDRLAFLKHVGKPWSYDDFMTDFKKYSLEMR